MREIIHVGVYALIQSTNNVLLIRKGRGPYKGLLDLPGGRIEVGESPEDALMREVKEETNLRVVSHTILTFLSKYNEYEAEDGVAEKMSHFGSIYKVTTTGDEELRTQSDGHDSLGAAYCAVGEICFDDLTPFAQAVLYQKADNPTVTKKT